MNPNWLVLLNKGCAESKKIFSGKKKKAPAPQPS